MTSRVLQEMVRVLDDREVVATRERFQAANPFPHAIVDAFFTPEFIDTLVQGFPREGDEDYDRFCRGDGGVVGRNYANDHVNTFPPAFAALDRLVASAEFRAYVTALTGIDSLEYDPEYFGGGIRESRSDIFLPPHIDFNHHPRTRSHRRLNLLFYLNEEWREEWGGNLQLHRDPNIYPEDNLVASYMPAGNRCLLFETSEISWHGFDRLRLPAGRTRRAFTIYYYTAHRPNEALVRFHNTEYVEPPLPKTLRAGQILTQEDIDLVREGYRRRDGRIRMLYDLRAEMDAKYRHVWSEYEYYLDRANKLDAERNSKGEPAPGTAPVARGVTGETTPT